MWISLIVLSGIVGAVCGFVRPGRRGVRFGGTVPWIGLLMWQLYHEYVAPYSGGGASTRPFRTNPWISVRTTVRTVVRQ